MRRGLIAGGVCLIAVAVGFASPAAAKNIGKGKMTLAASFERDGQLAVFVTSGKIKIKKKSESNCRKSRSVTYKAFDPNGQPIEMLAKLSRGNGTYADRNSFVYDVGGPLDPEEVPSTGGTYTFKAKVPKQRDLKRKQDKCVGLASSKVSVTVPPLFP